jgi:hypothetical protein
MTPRLEAPSPATEWWAAEKGALSTSRIEPPRVIDGSARLSYSIG